MRVYAYDPSLGADLATIDINEATLDVRWEDDLKPGPVGEYVEVIDVDPASRLVTVHTRVRKRAVDLAGTQALGALWRSLVRDLGAN